MAITIASRDGGRGAPASFVRMGARARAFAAAQRHSRLVRLLRIVLPVATGGVLVAYTLVVAASWHLNAGKFRIPDFEITADDLTMKNPSFVDVTSDGRYEVRAKRAVVAFNQDAPVKLIDVSGDLIQTGGTTTKLKAKHGLYEKAKGELELFDGIELDGSNGFMARLSRATIYAGQSKVVSKHPVSAITPTGSVQASAMTIDTKARVAQFRGAVTVRLLPSAQGAGLGADARQPVDIRAEELDIDDEQKVAHFRGKVVAIQGETMLQAPYLMVKYEGKAAAALASATPQAPAAGRDGARVTFLWVRHGVEITAGNDRRIASDLADFDVAADTALFAGRVVAIQDKNILKGDRLFIDRKTGRTRLETPGEGGRIAATFYQAPDSGAQAKRPRSRPNAEAVQQAMLGSFKTDPDAPMQLEANTLDVHEAGKKAVFSGNVMAQQGDMLLRTSELTAFFSGQTGLGLAADAGAKGRDKGQVVRLEARHSVVLASRDGQSATAKWANLDVKANTALLGGEVVVTKRGDDPKKTDVIKGDRLKIDLTTGMYRVESEAPPALAPRPPRPKGPATSSSPPAASAADAAKAETRTCAPGKTCALVYPKQVRQKVLDQLKKKAPAVDAR